MSDNPPLPPAVPSSGTQPTNDDSQVTHPEDPPLQVTSELQPPALPEGHEAKVPDSTSIREGETALNLCLRKLEADTESLPDIEKWKDIIDVPSLEDQQTPLQYAASKDFPKLAKLLIEADANLETGGTKRPLLIALNEEHIGFSRLLLEKGASPYCKDSDGWNPIHLAAWADSDEELVELLLERPSKPPLGLNETEGFQSWTPLNLASCHGRINWVKHLLKKEADACLQDESGWTPLTSTLHYGHFDIFDIIFEHLRKNDPAALRKIICQPAKDKLTIYMVLYGAVDHRKAYSALSALKKLLPFSGLDLGQRDSDGRTVLHYGFGAVREYPGDDHIQRMAELLVEELPKHALLFRNDKGQTAIEDGLNENSVVDFSQLPWSNFLQMLIRRLKGDRSDREGLLCWLASREHYHIHAETILRDTITGVRSADFSRIPGADGKLSLVKLAIWHELPHVLLECEVSEDDSKEGKALIKYLRDDPISSFEASKEPDSRQQIRKVGLEKSTTKQVGKKIQDVTKIHPNAARQPKVLDQMEDVLDYSVKKIRRARDPLKVSSSGDEMEQSRQMFEAAVVSICQDNSQFNRYAKFRSVKSIIYDNSPIRSISDTINEMKKTASKPGEESNFTWIHLPVTNMAWMIDTMNKILNPDQSDNLNSNDEDDQIASFLRNSGVQVPDDKSLSRYMQPRYVKKKKVKGDDNECLASALYMPFLEVGSYDKSTEDSQTHEAVGGPRKTGKTRATAATILTATATRLATFATRLNTAATRLAHTADATIKVSSPTETANKDIALPSVSTSGKKAAPPPVHFSPTLDEHYYHFDEKDTRSQEDRNSRNEHQIITKYLYPDRLDSDTSWEVLRVGQLWAWTIREKWLITSTSVANLREESAKSSKPFVEHVLEHLSDRAGQSPNGVSRTPTELSRVIVECCIGAYRKSGNKDQRVKIDEKDNARSRKSPRPSIRQMFSGFINQIGREEAGLFRKLAGVQSDPTPRETHLADSERGDANDIYSLDFEKSTRNAAKLLYDIKDVRDELNILRTIADYQKRVQRKLIGTVPDHTPDATTNWDEDETAAYVMNDIEELDKLAKKTEDALNTTITILESETANDQGKRVMVFTLVTVFFLPLSFLSSLFALDVNNFLEAPWWSLVIIFVVPLPFLHAANGYLKDRDPFTFYLSDKKTKNNTPEQTQGSGSRTVRNRRNRTTPDQSDNV
ncbi:hypothetical protein CPAR01_14515 [Colletotrichum paranaense]|uniref:Ankyrin repeat protein n=1 Tax=Colletotrichum paranaense TaxID=1914294 RepID=A0ABQ9S2D7_9PEZI|nr:uncharacterized protein CPAR01_14515 [Colletotrichum paranaense]KAK1522972.1 hypothetical protein CPAR01_14515 [Colletotrichum paranaense]